MMPRDVSTRWNSTFDILYFALDYRLAIDSITSTQELNLRKYELQDDEWAWDLDQLSLKFERHSDSENVDSAVRELFTGGSLGFGTMLIFCS
jgi:hypothetical protein